MAMIVHCAQNHVNDSNSRIAVKVSVQKVVKPSSCDSTLKHEIYKCHCGSNFDNWEEALWHHETNHSAEAPIIAITNAPQG